MYKERLSQAVRDPSRAWAVIRAILRGHAYRVWFRLRGRRVTIGRNFRVEGRLTVRGPGAVVFGDDVTVGMHVTPWTYDRKATITIGNNCFLNGTRFGCAKEIWIGEDGIIAEAHLLDTNFHSTRRDRRRPEAKPRIAPIRIERNVWIAANAGILPGTKIGENSVVGFGSVCSDGYPANSVIAGNPARVVRPVDQGPTSENLHPGDS